MGLPWNVNASMGGAGVNDQILRSLRFRPSASAYLNRTPASAGNRRTFTWSGWIKYCVTSNYSVIFSALNGSTDQDALYIDQTTPTLIVRWDANAGIALQTTQVFRDPSAWYHIIMAVDTTQATASNRMKLYVNGVQITAFTTANYPTLNQQANGWNTANPHYHGVQAQSLVATNTLFNGYMTEINFIDGQALTPASFGYNDPVTGVWQPAPFKGTYGTNGFYLPFTDIATTSGSNFGLGRDYSGNSNYWNTNNISVTAGTTYDSMIDSPTNFSDGSTYYNRGNYCTMNPLANSLTSGSLSNGNLTQTGTNGVQERTESTFTVSSGKWYFETVMTALSGTYAVIGIGKQGILTAYPGYDADSYGYYPQLAQIQYSGGSINYGSAFSAGDILMMAFDLDNSKLFIGKNGTWFASSDPATGANPAVTITSGLNYCVVSRPYNSSTTFNYNFGQRPFSYTPPTGYKALNTFNLPTPTIANGAAYMAATTYTGNGSTQTITNGGNNTIGKTFQPDWVWIKSRSAAYNNLLFDSIRGPGKALISNSTSAEGGNAGDWLGSFNSNGFSVNTTFGGGTDPSTNGNGATFVGWQWNAGSGTTSTNTSGSITSTVSANTTAGFSVVTYVGNITTGATVGHGLGVAPSMIIGKNRDTATEWWVYHSALGNTKYIVLNSTAAAVTSSVAWNNTSPTSSVFTLGGAGNPINANQDVAYCFAAVRGYSAFGSYTGNGSTDGPFIYTGFRPRYLLVKNISAAGDPWYVIDTSTSPYNVQSNLLQANSPAAELSGRSDYDILSNGFKNRATFTGSNTNGSTYIYAAFAENPFNYSRAR